MTSEVFVYVMLPQTVEFVTAGKLVISQDRLGRPIGRFVYGRSYLSRADAVAIDPMELPLKAGTFETDRMKGVFGALRDASPDSWGRRVIEKHSGLAQLEELDYLLQSPDDRAGALGFGLAAQPPAPLRVFNRTIDLGHLQQLADRVVAENEAEAPPEHLEQVQGLLLLGTSMGGARPKAVVEDQGQLWIAKFNRVDDRWNHARIEHAMLVLARECGLNVAESRVIQIADRDALLVRRFDRAASAQGFLRARMMSALTLLRTGESHQDRDRWSYVLLAEELRRISAHPREDARELFKRMVFNALISNTDDHPRNHAVIAPGTDWTLSPAYDLTPAPAISQERRDLALSIGNYGRYANRINLLSQAGRFLLEQNEASSIYDTLEAHVRERWYAIARSVGVSERDCSTLARAFVYDGLRLEPA